MAETNPFAQQSSIPGIKNILAVSSGKGGVGKSTIACNLALAFSQKGLRVGLLDADIYGPSAARMLGVGNQKPEINSQSHLVPIEKFGLKAMSFGFLVQEELAVVWRGPMLFKTMDQFLRGVAWGELDLLIVDMPPGTGDVHLSLAQKVPLVGAIAVTTPQNISLIDVKKAIDMWTRVAVPVLGVIENMAWLEQNGQRTILFPKGDLDEWLHAKHFEKLCEIPFDPALAQSCEQGELYMSSESGRDSVSGVALAAAAEKLIGRLRLS